MHPLNSYAYHQLSTALKLALELNELQLDDLLKEDETVLNQLKQSKSSEVVELIESISRPIEFIHSKEDFDIYQKTKLRTINPTIYLDGELFETSQKSSIAAHMTEQAILKNQNAIYLKIKQG